MKKKIILIFLFLIIGVILLIEFLPSHAPEIVYIRVLKADNQTPEENAFCKSNIITPNTIIEDKNLEKIDSLPINCYAEECLDENYNKGYYKLETELKNYKGKFEIQIVCITETGVSYTVLNNTHIPCEVKFIDGGKAVGSCN